MKKKLTLIGIILAIVSLAFALDTVVVKTDSYNVTGEDDGKVIVMNAATAKVVALPGLGSTQVGYVLTVIKQGAGAVTIDVGAGVVIADSTAGAYIRNTTSETYAAIRIIYSAVNYWKILGALGTWATDVSTFSTGVTLPVAIANGGTGASTKAAAHDALSPMSTLGDIVYGGASGTGTRLAGNIAATNKWLRQIGTGSASAAPTWEAITDADLPSTIKGFTLSPLATGFSIAAGTTPKTLTVNETTALNGGTIYKLPVFSAANSIGELAAVGATGEYLAGATGAIPVWATLNQAAVAGLTTASSPTFAGLTITGASGAVSASAGVLSAGTLSAGNGGTGQSSYTIGDILYASASGTLSKLAGGTAGYVLTAQGAGVAPAYAAAPTAQVVPHVIGVQWNQATGTWTYIDQDAAALAITQAQFDRHPVWGGIRRVNLNAAGTVVAAIGDQGFALDGANGRVMVEIPKFYVKTNSPSANVYQWFVSDVPLPGYYLHPAFKQSNGGAVTRAGNYLYIGAYAADLDYDGVGGHVEFNSRTGTQPMTGTEAIFSVAFTAGDNEPAIGDSLETATDSGWLVVDYVVASGAWATNDAAGTLYLRKPSDAACGFTNTEAITNTTQANALGTSGTPSALTLTLANARTYAGNIGTGWCVENIWEWSAVRLLMYIEYKGAALDTGIGLGVINKASGTGFAGELNGAASIDSNLAANGTGVGTGTNGLVPVAWRGIENPWGNVWQWVEGWNTVDGTDTANQVKYRIAKADGTTAFADSLATYDQLEATHTGLPDGYVSNVHFDAGFSLLFLPSAVAGASDTYLRDYYYEHNTGGSEALLAGGVWRSGANAGPGDLNSNYSAGGSDRDVGARLSFLR